MDLILVVDDSPVVRRVLSLTLENNGYIVLTAGNGLEALKIINQQDVRLVFCDIFMPKMNGIEFLKAVRSHRSKSELPIVMLTAAGEDAPHYEAIRAGANSLLTKPASSLEVIATAQSLIKFETSF